VEPALARLCHGVDGCRQGWAVVSWDTRQKTYSFETITHFKTLLTSSWPAMMAVDMPLGLPEQGGREAEKLIRPFLGARQSSVFSIPSRRAVYATSYRESCDIALATSNPPRKVSKQSYYLFDKIRELDSLITPDNQTFIKETHPELAFWLLNGKKALQTPKKIKGRVNQEGIEERFALLREAGFEEPFLWQKRPSGVGLDDLADACACCLVARRLNEGQAICFPQNPPADARGIPMAIHT
jgi:predicted RNase H-like nuclease